MSSPQTIAHYRITARLGQGGMGEVWRATDTKLGREVAIKILPESFAQDPDRLARFTREAQVLASLNHPNIAMIHGVEERALVMELVPGPTLAERIASGPIPLDEALPIARQIAEALEYAHERGIVHRDLKPANVKITPEGRVKVLDFGLAKAMTTEAPAGDSVSSPTLTMRAGASVMGTILGTAAYMSPEQARGQNVDRRTDIWAFGVVLYEMLTGRTLFAAPTISDTLAAVLRAEVDLSPIPQPVRGVVDRCLRKDVRQRWQAIGDARIALDEEPATAPAPTLTPTRRSYWWPAAAAILALALLWLAGMHFREQPPPTYQVSLLPPEKGVFVPIAAGNGGMAISQDGRTLAFVAAQEGRALLWVRRLDSSTARPLPGTENAHYPFWSPDNRWLGFFAGTQLKKIDVAGGPPQVICDATTTRGATWSQSGTIVFSGLDRTLHRVPASGGQPVKLTELDRAGQENAHYWPEFLPDGRHFLYLARSGAPGKSAIRIGSLETTPAAAHGIELTRASANARYVPPADGFGWGSRDGWLVFLRDTALFAQRFDTSALQLKGDAVALAERPGVLANISYANFSTSRNGVLLYGAEGSPITRLTWTGRDGKEAAAAPDAGVYLGPRLSLDGARVAVAMVERQAGNLDIWLIDLTHPVATRFTFDPAPDTSPVWSPDGKQVAFGSSREGRTHIYVKAANGATSEQRIDPHANSSVTHYPCDWSKDGKYLLYIEVGDNTGTDLWVLDLAGGSKASPFLKTPYNESLGSFSPDGKWIAYTSDESGRNEVYVRNFPGASAKFQISSNGGVQPRWRGDGKELYYLAADSKLMAVTVRAAADTFERDTPKALFEMRGVRSGGLVYDYDVTRDGQRFLSAVPVEAEGVRALTLVTDWRAQLSH